MKHEILQSLVNRLDAEVPGGSKTAGVSLSYRADNRLDAVEQIKDRFDAWQTALEGTVLDGKRLDAGESGFLARELLFVNQKQIMQLYTEMKSTRFIPINSSMPAGTDTFTTKVYREVGSAKFISNYATDWPSSDAFVDEVLGKVFSIGNSYGWTEQDLRRSALLTGGLSLESRRASTARLVHEKMIDDLLANGDSVSGLVGISNQSAVTILDGSPDTLVGDWATATADQIFADLALIENTVYNQSSELMQPDTLLLPTGAYAALFDTSATDFSRDSIGAVWLRSRAKYIKNIDQWLKLNTAGASSVTRAIAYKRSSDVLEGILPMAFTASPPKNFSGKKWDVLCESRCGGVVLYQPMAMVYADGV